MIWSMETLKDEREIHRATSPDGKILVIYDWKGKRPNNWRKRPDCEWNVFTPDGNTILGQGYTTTVGQAKAVAERVAL